MRKLPFYPQALLIVGLLFYQGSYAQNDQLAAYKSDPTIVSVPTPQAASIGKFGRVPVDLFNGLYDLSVPIYTLPIKGLPLDIKISYHGGGVKPSEKGGVVGVGWALAASGSITRIQNGTIDEHVNPNYTDSYLGYYWNKSQLNGANWADSAALNSLITEICCEGTPGSGSCPAVVPQWHDWAPDEFLFNIPGYSGSFWLDHLGNWVVRENSGEKLTVTVDFGYYSYKYPTAQDSVKMNYVFRKFTIKDGNGNTFIFGGDPNSIEFNRNPGGYSTEPAITTSWWLTQIITNKAEKVNYAYQRIVPSVSEMGNFNSYNAQLGANNYSFYNLQQVTGVIHDPVYLASIAYNKDSVKFSYSASNIFSYSTSPNLNPGNGAFSSDISSYYTTHSGGAGDLPSWELNTVYPAEYKLDNISVIYGSYARQFSFAYYDSTLSNRLFLKSFTIGPVTRPLVYKFSYNGMKFSTYSDGVIYDGLLTPKVDHWGYYNGKFPFKTSDLPQVAGGYYSSYNGYPNDDFIVNYIANRQPNSDSMKIGSLSRVTYPTGGYTNFVYEPHDYSVQLSPTTNQGISLGSNTMAGGLRIKEVDSYTDSLSLPFVKKYVYKNDSGLSSGVLNSAGVLYRDSVTGTSPTYGTFYYKYFSDNDLLPLQNANGNHVTYTRVEEVSNDSSLTVYRYTNHDNGHYDILPSYFINVLSGGFYYRQNCSRNFHRGKLISQSQYDSSRALISRDSVIYINDDSLTGNRVGIRSYAYRGKDVKMMSFLTNGGSLGGTFKTAFLYIPTLSPFVYYVHNYPLVQKTTTYFKGTDSLKTIETWQYDTSNNKVAIDSLKNLSDGSAKIIKYNYSPDYASGNAFYTGMVGQNVIDPVIKLTQSGAGGKVLQVNKDSLVKNTINGAGYYWLYEKDIYRVAADITKMNVLKYDSVGNPVDAVGVDGIPVTYIWDYGAMHPIAVTKGASSASVAFTSFEAEGTGNWKVPDATRSVNSMTGIQSYALTNAKTIIDTVPSGTSYIVGYWAKNGPAVVKYNGTTAAASLTGMTKRGWTYYEYQLPNTTTVVNVTGASASNTFIDELRLYPATAQMTSYTYAPLCGITSACTPSGALSFYEWDDAMARLLRVRDMDSNIVKQYDYNYLRYISPVYNTVQSQVFTKSNCGSGLIGGSYTYVVSPGKYGSYISVDDANQKALNEIAANGQHYADSLGTCYVQVSCNNSAHASGFTATYTNIANPSIVYSFGISSSGGVLGYIPQGVGRWAVTISNSSNSTIYTFSAGCGSTVDGTSASFPVVPVSPSCNVILISNPI